MTTFTSWMLLILSVLMLRVLPAQALTIVANDGRQDDVSNPSAQPNAKYNAYVRAYNALTGMFYGSHKGIGELTEQFKKQRLGERNGAYGAEPRMYLNEHSLKTHVEQLRRGVNIPNAGPYTKIDLLAKNMLRNSASLLDISDEYVAYLQSKKYLDDQYAKARILDAPYIKGWEQLLQDFEQMDDALSEAEHIHRLESIASFRQSGDHLSAATHEVIMFANELVSAFSETADFKDKGKINSGDALIAKIEKAIDEIRQESRKATNQRDVYRHGLIVKEMVSLVGDYRGIKGSWFPKAREFQNMTDRYNSALRQFDRIQ